MQFLVIEKKGGCISEEIHHVMIGLHEGVKKYKPFIEK